MLLMLLACEYITALSWLADFGLKWGRDDIGDNDDLIDVGMLFGM